MVLSLMYLILWFLLWFQYQEACNKYLEVLKLSKDADLRTDDLQLIHTARNLRELLDSGTGNTQPPGATGSGRGNTQPPGATGQWDR